MSDPLKITDKDLSGSSFERVKMAGTKFDDIDLSGADFFNINLRGAKFGGIDFGGASFSCMNTGEFYPQEPASFNDMESDNCTFQGGSFAGVRIVGARLDGMTIDGLSVPDMIEAYKKAVGE